MSVSAAPPAVLLVSSVFFLFLGWYTREGGLLAYPSLRATVLAFPFGLLGSLLPWLLTFFLTLVGIVRTSFVLTVLLSVILGWL